MQNKWNDSIVPIDLQLGYTQKDFGANGFYTPRFPNQHELLHTFFVSLKSDATAGRFNISPAVYWRRNYDRFSLDRHAMDARPPNFHYTDAYGADVIASLVNRFGRTSAGILVRNESVFSNVLGKQMEPEERRKVRGQSDKWYDKSDRRTNISAFLEQNIHLGKWSASLGALANSNNYTNGKVKIYPGIDMAFRPNQLLRIYASANMATRLPTFTDLYYQTATHISNPELTPEKSTEYELGTKITSGIGFFNVSYFYRTINNAIDWIWLTDQEKWQTMNHTDIYTHGISMGGVWNIGENLPVQTLSAFYTFMSSSKWAYEYRSNYVMDYLRHKLNLGVTHRIVEKVCAHWQIGWQDRNGGFLRYNAETDIFDTEATPYAPFWKIDLRIYRQTERMNIFVEAANLGDKQYQDIGNVLLPGRWIRAGIAFTLK